jgi:hypothetical protein
MLKVWRKPHAPQLNKQSKTTQIQKATFPSNHLVTAKKPPHPHKEKKQEQHRIQLNCWKYSKTQFDARHEYKPKTG